MSQYTLVLTAAYVLCIKPVDMLWRVYGVSVDSALGKRKNLVHCGLMFEWRRYAMYYGYLILCVASPLGVRGAEALLVPCHTIGGVNQEIPSGYGSPRNLFSSSPPLVLEARCGEDGTVQVRAGASATYVYQYGREKVGNTWKDMVFSGPAQVGAWFVGTANATLTAKLMPGERTSFLAYVCQLVKGVWKCGCRDEACTKPYWQAQEAYLPTIDVWPDDPSLRTGLHVDAVSEYLVGRGDTLTILGSGFSRSTNDVLWDDGVWVQEGIASPTGTTLSVRVPRLTIGKHRVQVRAEGVRSGESAGVWIAAKNVAAPVISIISPATGPQGGTFTLRGTGFGRINDLFTMFGRIEDLPSDGATITFTYAPFGDTAVRFRTATGTLASYTAQVPIMVLNENGMSVHKLLGLEM